MADTDRHLSERFEAATTSPHPDMFHDLYVLAAFDIEGATDARRCLSALLNYFGQSTNDMARRLGISHVAVSRWMSATDPLPIMRRRQIAGLLQAAVEGRALACKHRESTGDTSPMLAVYRGTVEAGRRVLEAEFAEIKEPAA